MKQNGIAKACALGLRGMVAFCVIGAVVSATAAEPKRVLIINSFGSAAPPFSIHQTSFESELVKNLGEGVSLDEVSLDFARYDDPGMQEAMVEDPEKRQASWRPDLVVPIAAPALIFVANHYERLFPGIPILGVAANQRFLPQGAWEKNAAYVGHEISVSGLIEDMLQVAPATKNIDFVLGATSLERRWREALQKETAPFAGRIKFTYYNGLSFQQMMERVSALPPDSFIFFFILLRDVDGVTLKSDEALRKLHQVATAPMNALFNHQLGTGSVGGRLLDGDRLGKEAAAVGVRILHGESPSSIPPVILARLPPRYDWRELQRWKIDEKLLPTGSTILFREHTVWERYWGWIMGGVSVVILQALLITGLVASLVKRHRVERALKQAEEEALYQREQIHLLGRVSLLGEMAASLAHELGQPLAAITTNANAGMRFIEGNKVDRAMLKEILADVVAAAHRAYDIIQNVRNAIKKGDSGQCRIDLNELVTSVAHVVRLDAVGHSCELETSLAKDLPLIEGDPVQIQQVLINLVSNAFDSMRHTPPSQRRVEIRTEANGNGGVRLSVRDHGTGIPREALERVFDRFFTTKEKGLGMGLAIVLSIVEAHGGKIEAANVAEGGARFRFTLPAAKAEG